MSLKMLPIRFRAPNPSLLLFSRHLVLHLPIQKPRGFYVHLLRWQIKKKMM